MAANRPSILPPGPESIETAARLLREGKLVAFPTETVYGLGGDATNDRAVAAIFETKERPSFNPLIVHFPDELSIWPHVKMDKETREKVKELSRAFWPGPLTMVLNRAADTPLSLLVSAGLDTVAVRVPFHPVAHDLLRAANRPLAAPSANRSGSISPTQASHVADSLQDRIEAVLDGGACSIGLESTVVSFHAAPKGRPVLLRPGGITQNQIEAIIGPIDVVDPETSPKTLRAPGMLQRHYAPETRVRLNAKKAAPQEILLGFGPNALDEAPEGSLNLSETGDLREAAANLFAMLRQLDALGRKSIVVMPIPDEGLGLAINDRLRRAAAPESP